ncbi:MAG: hypothetical protein M5R36_20100 [Deltaproteobacteria bacterium]|nr:hypothetical protein [Deltaproteobacteria bacterium]
MGSVAVNIVSPAQGADIDGYTVNILVTLGNFNVATDTIMVTIDETDVTEFLAITNTQIVGVLNIDAGEHDITVIAENATGVGQDTNTFNIDMGKITIHEPEPGSFYNYRDIPVNASFVNLNPATIHVQLQPGDGAPWQDWTGDMAQIGGGAILGELPFMNEGDYTMWIWGTHPNHVNPDTNPDGRVEDLSFFTVELVPAHIVVSVDRTQIEAGETVNVSYQLIDEDGEDRTGEVPVLWNVVPATGVTVNEGAKQVTFAQPGLYEITLSANLDGDFIEGTAHVIVDAQAPGSVEVDLSSYEVDAGDFVLAWATVFNEEGEEIYGQIVWSAWPTVGVTVEQGNPATVTLRRAGDITIRATVKGTGVFGEAVVHVNAGDPWRMDLVLPQPVINEGGFTTPAVFLEDQWGNIIEEIEAIFTVFPTTGVVMNSPQDGDITFNIAGAYSVSATAEDPWGGVHDTESLLVIDVSPPAIEIWTPERGLWVNDEVAQMHGIVHGCDWLNDTVQFSHEPGVVRNLMAPPSECEFDASFPLLFGLNILEVLVTEDASGLTSSASVAMMKGPKIPDNTVVDKAMWLRLNERGFFQLSQIAIPILREFLDQLPYLIYAMNPVFDEKYKFWGITIASARAEVRHAEFGDPGFILDVADDLGIDLEAWVDDIWLEFRVRGKITFFSYSISGDIGFDRVGITADTNIFVDEFGRFRVTLRNIHAYFLGFHFEINNFPDELEDWFEDDIKDLIQDIVNDMLSEQVPPILEDFLSQIPTDFSFEVDGKEFIVDYNFDYVAWDRDGGTFFLDAGISTPHGSPRGSGLRWIARNIQHASGQRRIVYPGHRTAVRGRRDCGGRFHQPGALQPVPGRVAVDRR